MTDTDEITYAIMAQEIVDDLDREFGVFQLEIWCACLSTLKHKWYHVLFNIEPSITVNSCFANKKIQKLTKRELIIEIQVLVKRLENLKVTIPETIPATFRT